MNILDVLVALVCSFVQIALEQEIHKFEEHLIGVYWFDVLICGGNTFPVDDLNLVLDSLSSVVLWVHVLWLELSQISHLLHFGNG